MKPSVWMWKGVGMDKVERVKYLLEPIVVLMEKWEGVDKVVFLRAFLSFSFWDNNGMDIRNDLYTSHGSPDWYVPTVGMVPSAPQSTSILNKKKVWSLEVQCRAKQKDDSSRGNIASGTYLLPVQLLLLKDIPTVGLLNIFVVLLLHSQEFPSRQSDDWAWSVWGQEKRTPKIFSGEYTFALASTGLMPNRLSLSLPSNQRGMLQYSQGSAERCANISIFSRSVQGVKFADQPFFTLTLFRQLTLRI